MPATVEPISLDGSRQRLHPRIRTVWGLAGAITGAVLGLGGIVVLIVVAAPPAAFAATVALSLIWAGAAFGSAHLRYSRWSWAAWPDAVELHHGVIVAHQSVVPYHRIQQIDIHRGPLDRMLGLSALVLRTAAATTDAHIPGIAAGAADALRVELLGRSGIDDAV